MARYTDTDRHTALRLLRTMPREAVMDVIGCQRRTINRWAAAIGLDLRRGKGGAKRKIPAKTEDKIAALAVQGLSQNAIARRVGWSATTVMRALRRKGVHP
jgi:DNA-binding NarL/FixJ family response regulator